MTAVVAAVVAVLGIGVGVFVGVRLRPRLLARRVRTLGERQGAVRKILLPFTGRTISRRALEAAVRLARAENAVIMPAFLARVPNHLPLDAPVAHQCTDGMALLEAIDQRASARGVQVDSRISRGRTYRDALQRLIEQEPFDRIIISTTDNERTGLNVRDLQWLLQRVDAEVMILRPAFSDHREITSGASVAGHF
jgi:Universal stress protein family